MTWSDILCSVLKVEYDSTSSADSALVSGGGPLSD